MKFADLSTDTDYAYQERKGGYARRIRISDAETFYQRRAYGPETGQLIPMPTVKRYKSSTYGTTGVLAYAVAAPSDLFLINPRFVTGTWETYQAQLDAEKELRAKQAEIRQTTEQFERDKYAAIRELLPPGGIPGLYVSNSSTLHSLSSTGLLYLLQHYTPPCGQQVGTGYGVAPCERPSGHDDDHGLVWEVQP
jgi:hypothetical protein